MVEDLRSMISLLTISRGGTTVRLAAWPESIRSHGEEYEPFRFMFVLGGGDRSTIWKRVEIKLDHAMTFPAPFPREGPLNATLQIVTDRDREHIIKRFVGALTFDNEKIYFEPRPLESPG